MKIGTLIAAGVILVAFLAWRKSSTPVFQLQSSAIAQTRMTASPIANPTPPGDLKVWLFADKPLEEIGRRRDVSSRAEADDPWHLFALALSASQQSNVAEAKKNLRQVVALPGVETRISLLAWNVLRELGEKPDVSIANELQGVVLELHNEAGVGTVAAYVDGRARCLGGQGKVIIWEAPDSDAEISMLIKRFLRSAQPLVMRAPSLDRHDPSEPKLNHVRASLLTYGGIHIVEVFGPEIIDEKHFMAPTLMASGELLHALAQKTDGGGKKLDPR
jgi:hypothetical protein